MSSICSSTILGSPGVTTISINPVLMKVITRSVPESLGNPSSFCVLFNSSTDFITLLIQQKLVTRDLTTTQAFNDHLIAHA